ncbi:19865_t:CDS:1, partial [Dentiscutata erythropus]
IQDTYVVESHTRQCQTDEKSTINSTPTTKVFQLMAPKSKHNDSERFNTRKE